MNGRDHLELLRRDGEDAHRLQQQGPIGICCGLLSRFDVTGRAAGLARRIGLTNRDFTIVSDNCWGGYVYRHYGLRYRSPFVGLFLFPQCYIELLEQFDESLASELDFIDAGASKYPQVRESRGRSGEYPIGTLRGSVEIHFLHYRTPDEAQAKWLERKRRISHDNVLFKMSDRLGPAPELVRRFDALPFRHKLFLAAQPHPVRCARSPLELDLKAFLNGMKTSTCP